MYKTLVRPLLFRLPPEAAHHFAFAQLGHLLGSAWTQRLARRWYALSDPALARQLWGLTFPNPIGLAAGFDKNAERVDAFAALGFGFVEIGTLTPRPQPGNPAPRLFRLPADGALINRMGFNNEGAAAAALRLQRRRSHVMVGGNIGKNKDTPNEAALADYLHSYDALREVVDYFVVNVSSPNTPNLRALQEKAPLRALLTALLAHNAAQAQPRPILLKIAPDLSLPQLDDVLDIVLDTGTDGLIATNTTIGRAGLRTPAGRVTAYGAGGLSGPPLRDQATAVIRHVVRQTNGRLPIIGVGGITTPDDALEKLDAGAALIQLYTGFVYEGPALIRNIQRALLSRAHARALPSGVGSH